MRHILADFLIMKEDDNTTDLHRGVRWISTYMLYRIVSGRYVCSTVLLFTLVTSNFSIFGVSAFFIFMYFLGTIANICLICTWVCHVPVTWGANSYLTFGVPFVVKCLQPWDECYRLSQGSPAIREPQWRNIELSCWAFLFLRSFTMRCSMSSLLFCVRGSVPCVVPKFH